jgi:folylpolyglutamate synthase/dihydropteroate synthase
VFVAASPAEAVEAARVRAAPEDVVLVAGSLYLVGAVKAYLERGEGPATTQG